jgi:CheY-like chemotaxis protein/DNA-binding transcriptional ArsR family regulator
VRILLVDDDAVFREELGDLLSSEGHTVDSAPSVPKALEILEGDDFDVVFTDLKMPRHPGTELVRAVRARWPRTMVVMITGYATVETAVEAMRDGAFDYIRKPFKIEQVQQALRLIADELKFRGEPGGSTDLGRLLREWERTGSREVLYLTNRAAAPRPHVTVQPYDPAELSKLRDLVEGFRHEHPDAAIVVEGGEQLFTGHRRQDVLAFLSHLRESMDGRGQLVVAVDPDHVSATDLVDLRAAVVGPATRETLELLSNPLRRAVLRRAAQGPCSFSEAMAAAELDDSPKISFHLRKLVDGGLLAHGEEVYRITPRGREAVRILGEMDAMSRPDTTVNAVLTGAPGRARAS